MNAQCGVFLRVHAFSIEYGVDGFEEVMFKKGPRRPTHPNTAVFTVCVKHDHVFLCAYNMPNKSYIKRYTNQQIRIPRI